MFIGNIWKSLIPEETIYHTIDEMFHGRENHFTDIVRGPNHETVLIIESKHGMNWRAQVNGLMCSMRYVKGYCFNLGTFLQDVDSCSCHPDSDITMESLRALLNEKFEQAYEQCQLLPLWGPFSLSVNDEKIKELCEGWFPVNVLIRFLNDKNEIIYIKANGYIHTGNCD